MTTFLSIGVGEDAFSRVEEVLVLPYCGEDCRDIREGMFVDTGLASYRDDDRYEFDETCAKCGAFIPASEISQPEPTRANPAPRSGADYLLHYT